MYEFNFIKYLQHIRVDVSIHKIVFEKKKKNFTIDYNIVFYVCVHFLYYLSKH